MFVVDSGHVWKAWANGFNVWAKKWVGSGEIDVIPYDHKSAENIEMQGIAGMYDPQFEFGYGLSYTSFTYSELQLATDQLIGEEELIISVKVQNTGARVGAEIVQLYIRDHYASITPAVKRLRAFEKIHMEAGDSKIVEFSIWAGDLAFVGRDGQWITEAGSFTAMIGGLKADFTFSAAP